jgi:hypothetical protein
MAVEVPSELEGRATQTEGNISYDLAKAIVDGISNHEEAVRIAAKDLEAAQQALDDARRALVHAKRFVACVIAGAPTDAIKDAERECGLLGF